MCLVALWALPALAQALASPAGIWEIEMRDSRYKVDLCGDGTALCARLIWLGRGADNADNLPYLGRQLIEAVQTAPNQWQGELQVYGRTAAGTIAQVEADRMTVTGCIFIALCRSYQLYRYDGP